MSAELHGEGEIRATSGFTSGCCTKPPAITAMTGDDSAVWHPARPAGEHGTPDASHKMPHPQRCS
jgi:hypothetical protein